jgi:hypothetical protein
MLNERDTILADSVNDVQTYSQNTKCQLKFIRIFDFKHCLYHKYSTNIYFMFHFVIYLSLHTSVLCGTAPMSDNIVADVS